MFAKLKKIDCQYGPVSSLTYGNDFLWFNSNKLRKMRYQSFLVFWQNILSTVASRKTLLITCFCPCLTSIL